MSKYVFQNGGEPDNFFSNYADLIIDSNSEPQYEAPSQQQEAATPVEEETDFIKNLRDYDKEQETVDEKEQYKQMFESYIQKIDEKISYLAMNAEEQDLFSDFDETELAKNYDTRVNTTPYFNRTEAINNSGNHLDKIATAIAAYESSNNPKALGNTVKTGMYAGQRALGKYQIMPGNLPQWSKEALGREVTREEFMANPDLQDKIAKHQMNKIYQKYGNPEDVASVWLTGKPAGRNNTAKDVNGIDSNQYIKNVMRHYK